MLPLGVVGRTDYRPYATFFLLVVNVLVFGVQALVGLQDQQAVLEFYKRFALDVCLVGQAPVTHLALTGVTSLFLHAGLEHLLFNMVFLWIFAPRVEAYLGHRNFLAFYLTAGVVASAAHVLLGGTACSPAMPFGFIIGASGAIAGALGAFLYLQPGAKVDTAILFWRIPFGNVRVPAWSYLLIWLGQDVFLAVFGGPDGVARWAHIGGFVIGFIMVFLVSMFKPVPDVKPLEDD